MSGEQGKVNWTQIYRDRRNRIRETAGGGVILWLGHLPQPRNYADNTYPFRQSSHFLYYTGLAEPDLALLSYPDEDNDALFARPTTMDDIVWSGKTDERAAMARAAGVEMVEDIAKLGVYLTRARSQGLAVHYLPPFQGAHLFRMAELLVEEPAEVTSGASRQLMEAVATQRSVKEDVEVAEIENALAITDTMHRAAMATARPGIRGYEVAAAIQGVALAANRQQAYLPIVTVHGEILHDHSYDAVLEPGRLLLNDSGAESPRFYASDITRTFPVDGRFSPPQREIYEIVLGAQLGAIEKIRPGLEFREVHLQGARILAEGLKAAGLMKGDVDAAVEAGAHALFFPHGIGHMLGLDVHDMEDLGDVVGYPRGVRRSAQFGLNFLRLNRPLEAGFVLTVEPGIYFIPALIERWKQEKKHEEFIRYERLEPFLEFGGIRIEDNVLVTGEGARVLGPGIPKTIDEVEAAMAAS